MAAWPSPALVGPLLLLEGRLAPLGSGASLQVGCRRHRYVHTRKEEAP